MQRQQERGGDGLNPRRDCSNFIKPQNWVLKEVCGSLPSRQESPDRRSSVVTRPLASLTSGQALDQQRLGQRLSVGCSGDAGTQTEGGATPRLRTLKAKRAFRETLWTPLGTEVSQGTPTSSEVR